MAVKNSLNDSLAFARLMAAGINDEQFANELQTVSLNEEYATNITNVAEDLSKLDTEQEKLKAELKACTARLEETHRHLDELLADSRKRVKIAIPQQNWKEFGIYTTK